MRLLALGDFPPPEGIAGALARADGDPTYY